MTDKIAKSGEGDDNRPSTSMRPSYQFCCERFASLALLSLGHSTMAHYDPLLWHIWHIPTRYYGTYKSHLAHTMAQISPIWHIP
jgi:hypothetical protein